jgi:hypothetical protein
MATHELAKGLAGLGRNGDSVLVHMQPQEVAGLQHLAKINGTTLTINPHTGMPEAFNLGGFLKSLLPMVAGFALGPAGFGMFTGPNAALQAGLAVGAATGAVTGDLGQGIMAGLGGYGGANLGGTLAKAGAGEGVTKSAEELAKASTADLAKTTAANPEGFLNAQTANTAGTNTPYMSAEAAVAPTPQIAPNFTPQPVTNGIAPDFSSTAKNSMVDSSALGSTGGGYTPGADIGTSTFSTTPQTANYTLDGVEKTASFGGNPNYATQANNFGMDAAAAADPSRFDFAMKGLKNLPSEAGYEAFKNAGGSAMQLGMPALGLTMGAMTPEYEPLKKKKLGILNLNSGEPLNLNREYAGGGMIDTPQNSIPTGGLGSLFGTKDGTRAQNTPLGGYGYGGSVGYAQGGMLHGPGDGMSDSIPATIEGQQPARLADGEFVVPADVVSHLGNGSTKAGSQRLYGMLDKVRKARTGTKQQGKQIKADKYLPG